MPYIRPERRRVLTGKVDDLLAHCRVDGEVNYVITRLIHGVVLREERNYTLLQNMVGLLECAKQEFIKQVVEPYEAKKKVENGPVSELDTPTRNEECP